MIEIILHDICDTFPYLKYGLAAAVCTALALTVLNHSRIMDKEKRSNYVSLLGKSMFCFRSHCCHENREAELPLI